MQYFDTLMFRNSLDAVSSLSLSRSKEWQEWRYCYEGGLPFLNKYLKMRAGRETNEEFNDRKDISPIPAYAKRAVNRVKNSLFQRFDDIIRRNMPKEMQAAVSGRDGGVDNHGRSMSAFLGDMVLPDILVMGQIGVLLDAPYVPGDSLYNVPAGYRPYLCPFSVENIFQPIPTDPGQPGEFKAITLSGETEQFSLESGRTVQQYFRHYWIDEETGYVNIVFLSTIDGSVQPLEDTVIRTKLKRIPFCMGSIGDSLMRDVCGHQKALLNMVSSDTSYGLESNFPFLTRQKSNADGSHLNSEDDGTEIGVKKGLWYGRGLERPDYISPPSEPMRLSIDLRRELKAEIEEQVLGAVGDLADGSVDAGLAFIGEKLESLEQKIWSYWQEYQGQTDEKPVVVSYPSHWCIKTDVERTEEADKLLSLMFKIPGRKIKKEIAKMAVDKLLRGKVSNETLDAALKEIDEAKYCTSDPAIIFPAKKEGIFSGDTCALALGGEEGEYDEAQKDQAERAAVIAKAQSEAADAARGNPDMSVNPTDARAEKEDMRDGELDGDQKQTQRGPDKEIPNLED